MTLHWKQSISLIWYVSAFPEMYQFQSTRDNTYKKAPVGLLRVYLEGRVKKFNIEKYLIPL